MVGHPTVAILPAALALAEARHASGKDLIEAFVAGYETVCLVGAMVAPSHYSRGFHVTGTVGTFGAAAACAKLLKLDHERTRMAFGIAATQAAGLKSMFGTMCKPLHAGKANDSRLLAAQLAARGFTSRTDAIECALGFAATQSDALDTSVAMEPGIERYNLPDNLFKYHASCYQTHAAIEAIRSLRRQHQFADSDVAEIVIKQDAGADTVCNIAAPANGLQTKFSLRMMAAYAVNGLDTADIDGYTDGRAHDPGLIALRDRVRVTFVPDWPIIGMVGKWAIHPAQIDPALSAFTPSQEAVDAARAMTKAYREAEAQGLGAVNYNGEMIDAATVRIVKNIIDMADRIGM